MLPEKKECVYISKVLEQTKTALLKKEPSKLKDLSNQTIHSACNYQDEASITVAVIIYTLSKLIERDDYKKIKNWDFFVKKFNSLFDLAIKALKDNNERAYQSHIRRARKLLESHSITLKPYVKEVIKKASINKGSQLHEHGISLEQTSRLLGITQWELADYIGQRDIDSRQNKTIDVRQRAKLAMEFFQ